MWEIDEDVIAIFLADIHLSLKPPVWRSAESDWMETQCYVLAEITDLQRKYNCPILCAGDIFDKNKKVADGWDASAELINFALEYLPANMYAIPGQHDLPNHRYENISRSAYWTLMKADKIKNVKELSPIELPNFIVCGFPFGSEICPLNYTTDKVKIAIIHKYVWSGNHRYPNAPDEAKLTGNKTQYIDRKWFGYDVIVYGDNHKGFMVGMGKTTVFNCGTLMRRKSDEINYKPQVGLLLESGKVVPHYLDISEDKYIESDEDSAEPKEEKLDLSSVMQELKKLGKTDLDFEDVMKQFLSKGLVVLGKLIKTSPEAKQIILEAMESQK